MLCNILIFVDFLESLFVYIEWYVMFWLEYGNCLLFFKGDLGDFVVFVYCGCVYKMLYEFGGCEIIFGYVMLGDFIGENMLICVYWCSFIV